MIDIQRSVQALVQAETGTDTNVAPNTVLDDISGWDSVSMAGVLMALEEEYSIRIGRHQVVNLHTVGDLERLVRDLSLSADGRGKT